LKEAESMVFEDGARIRQSSYAAAAGFTRVGVDALLSALAHRSVRREKAAGHAAAADCPCPACAQLKLRIAALELELAASLNAGFAPASDGGDGMEVTGGDRHTSAGLDATATPRNCASEGAAAAATPRNCASAEAGAAAAPRFVEGMTASAALLLCGRLGETHLVRSCSLAGNEEERGLFASVNLPCGSVVCELDGAVRFITPTTVCGPHCVRFEKKRMCFVDGGALARGLLKRRDGSWWPARPEDERRGYGAIANSARGTEEEPTMRLVCLLDDTSGLGEGSRALKEIDGLGYRLFLVAERDIRAGEELTWDYPWVRSDELKGRPAEPPEHCAARDERARKRGSGSWAW